MNTDYSNIVAATGDNLAAFPGCAFGGASIARVVMGGGGGGAGDQNSNSTNTRKISGGTGSGIVLVRSGSLSGGVTIDVRGGVATPTQTTMQQAPVQQAPVQRVAVPC